MRTSYREGGQRERKLGVDLELKEATTCVFSFSLLRHERRRRPGEPQGPRQPRRAAREWTHYRGSDYAPPDWYVGYVFTWDDDCWVRGRGRGVHDWSWEDGQEQIQ